MIISISEKSPVFSKLLTLGRELDLEPSMLAAGMCHAALNRPAAPPAAAEPVHSPIALPVPPPSTASEPEDELPEHDIDAAFDNFMTR